MKFRYQLLIGLVAMFAAFAFIFFTPKAGAFEGPYIGGSFGGLLSPVNHLGDKITDIVIAGGTGGTSFKDQWQAARKPSLNFTVNVGFGSLFDKHYCGIEGSINKSRYRVKILKSRQDYGLNTHDELQLNLRDVDFAIDYKHGYLISKDTMVFAKTGIARTRARLTLISNTTIKFVDAAFDHADHLKNEKTIHPLRFGFGVEHKLFDRISATADYTYSRRIGSFKLSGQTSSDTPAGKVSSSHNHKMTIQNTSIMFGLKTYF